MYKSELNSTEIRQATASASGDTAARRSLRNMATIVFLAGMTVLSGCKKPDDSTKDGPGTATEPLKVANVADLKRVGSDEKGPEGEKWAKDKHYLQVADIDLSGEGNWKPIGGEFDGKYDGGGYTISNLTVVAKDANRVGLFGRIYNGTVVNVRLNNVNISGSGFTVGCVVGDLYAGTVDHCSVNDVTINGEFSFAGGIAGTSGYTAVKPMISNCMVTNGTISNSKDGKIGGVVGQNSGGGTTQNCYTTVTVSGSGTNGGIVGYGAKESTVQYCYATGNITSESNNVGGIVGGTYCTTQNCVALNEEITRTTNGDLGRVMGKSSGDNLLNNYARQNMKMTADGTPISPTDATTTGKDGADVSEADYSGANSGTWWSSTAGFPESSWDFAPNRLPHLKGFSGLTQNPTVTP